MITELFTSIAYACAHLIHITLIIVNYALIALINIIMLITFNTVLTIAAVVATSFLINTFSAEINNAKVEIKRFIDKNSKIFNPLFAGLNKLWNTFCRYTKKAYNYIKPIVYKGIIKIGKIFLQTSINIAKAIYSLVQSTILKAYNSELSQSISNFATDIQLKPFLMHLALVSMATHIYFGPVLVFPAAVCFITYYLKCTFDTLTQVDTDDNVNPIPTNAMVNTKPIMNPVNEAVLADDPALVAQF